MSSFLILPPQKNQKSPNFPQGMDAFFAVNEGKGDYVGQQAPLQSE